MPGRIHSNDEYFKSRSSVKHVNVHEGHSLICTLHGGPVNHPLSSYMGGDLAEHEMLGSIINWMSDHCWSLPL